MATTGINGWRFPSYSDSPDVPRDLGVLATDIAAFIAANPGPQGTTGPRGSSVLNGSVDPVAGTGVDGDFYIWNGREIQENQNNFLTSWDKLTSDDKIIALDISKKLPIWYMSVDDTHKISNSSYANLDIQKKKQYKLYSVWDNAFDNNEKNRRIKLLRTDLINDFLKDWEEASK